MKSKDTIISNQAELGFAKCIRVMNKRLEMFQQKKKMKQLLKDLKQILKIP